ncbi:MAG TPA: SchA/CurD-like domain-containing protein [Actinokineospora sp.]|jgi:hypothetical protein|nr:SchA/CurD-like domain-containing protein [Actinokineospora sp.]
MPIAAISYDILPGFEDEIGEIFANFQRPASPSVQGDDGAEVAKILGTAVFIKNDTMVRFIEYEGDLTEVAKFMAAQPGVQAFERKIVPYLSKPRDTATPEGFVRTFTDSTMRCLTLLGSNRITAG